MSRQALNLLDDIINPMPSVFDAVKNNQSFIAGVADLTPGIIAVYNIQTGQYVYINNSLKPILGYSPKEWVEKGVKFALSKIHPDDLPRIIEENKHALEQAQNQENLIVEFEYRVMDTSNNYKWLKTYGTVFDKDRLGKVLHVINISLDITSIKETEERILQLAGSIEKKTEEIIEQKQIEKQKDEFISIASHELKTPLTTIKSFTEILKMQFGKEQKALHYLEKMDKEIDRLTGLVNELLDVSKIQSGGLTLNRERVDLIEFINEVVEDIQPTSTQHKIIFKKKSSLGKILMDKHRIYQVLINLISNAIKYSPKSNKVIISVDKTPYEAIFSVKDFGIGITKRDKKKIFDAFFQANTTIRQSYSGLGLGLHISKEIISRHGGKISVYSKKGIGSLFKFSIPTKKAYA